jgi:tripartite-type tricarboxylate transporter receptor subunit TctC
MKLVRRKFLELAAGAAMLPALPSIVRAQEFPSRPVRVTVCFPPGFAADTIARLICMNLSEKLGQQFVVDNRPGAGGDIGVEAVVRSPADGYSLLLTTSGNSISASMDDNPRFNFVRDIVPVGMIGTSAYIFMAHPSVPAKTLPEFIAYAKANPGKINMASPGVASGPHIVGELFKMTAGIDLVHVPYRASLFPDLLGGQVQVSFGPIAQGLDFVREGKLRGLGVTTPTRLNVLPDVPAIAEVLPGYEAVAWFGIGAPKNTPPEIIAKLNSALNSAVSDPTIKTRLTAIGTDPKQTTPAEFDKFISSEVEKWVKVVKFASIKRT